MSDKISREVAEDIIADVTGRLAEIVKSAVEQYIEEPEVLTGGLFAVGDRVEVLRDYASGADVQKGDKGTVTGFDCDNDAIVKMDDTGTSWYFRSGEGLDIKPEAPAFPFPVGTRVRVLADKAFLADVKEGDEGEVFNVEDNPYYGPLAHVTMDSDGETWYFRAEDIEEVTVEPRTLKVGDTVEIPASLNSVWVGTGKVVEEVRRGFLHDATVLVKMVTGDMTGLTGGFDVSKVTFVSEKPKPEPAWAEGDRVLVDGESGTIEYLSSCGCCDGVDVQFDNGDYQYTELRDLESLDERELEALPMGARVEVGDELILVEKRGDYYSTIKAGEKVTVTVVGQSRYGDYDPNLVTAETEDGRTTTRYVKRFALAE